MCVCLEAKPLVASPCYPRSRGVLLHWPCLRFHWLGQTRSRRASQIHWAVRHKPWVEFSTKDGSLSRYFEMFHLFSHGDEFDSEKGRNRVPRSFLACFLEVTEAIVDRPHLKQIEKKTCENKIRKMCSTILMPLAEKLSAGKRPQARKWIVFKCFHARRECVDAVDTWAARKIEQKYASTISLKRDVATHILKQNYAPASWKEGSPQSPDHLTPWAFRLCLLYSFISDFFLWPVARNLGWTWRLGALNNWAGPRSGWRKPSQLHWVFCFHEWRQVCQYQFSNNFRPTISGPPKSWPL